MLLKKIFLYLILINVNTVFSQQISNYEINKIAINFYKAYIDSNFKTEKINFGFKYYDYQSYPCLIIIKYIDNNWLLMSNDKKSFPILAFSNQKNYSDFIPENVKFWFNEYSTEVLNNLTDDSFKEYVSDTIWNYFINGNFKAIKSGGVNSFVLSKWGQSSSNDGNDSYAYNFYTPSKNDNEQCLHTLAGCPALAAGQIIRYLKYPNCSNFNYENMTYELNTSDIDYLSRKKEIANLLRNLGDKMDSNGEYYGCSASGTNEQAIYNAIKNDFSFYDAQFKKRENYGINEWKSILINELDNYRPILYMGYSNSGGHAFVCDGYKDLTFGKKFHFNFGWNGAYNGFYRINNPQGFSSSQSAIIYLHANNCNSYKEINWFDKYSFGSDLFYYNPIYGTIYSSPTIVIIQNNEVVHYRAYNEIILENFETDGNAEFTAENISCNTCNFINYDELKKYSEINIVSTSNKKPSINVFPNPFSSSINIISDNQNINISLLNVYGKYIIAGKPLSSFTNYDLSSLSNGVYVLEIKDNDKIEYIKIIKQ